MDTKPSAFQMATLCEDILQIL